LATQQHTKNKESYLDLVFESKNKEYGAYLLRTKNSTYTAIGFLVSCLLIVGAFSLHWLFNKQEAQSIQPGTIKMQHKKVIGYSQLNAPPPIEVSPPPEAAPPKTQIVKPRTIASRKFLPPTVKPDEEVADAEAIPTQEELKVVNPGKKTVEGDTLSAVTPNQYEETIIEIDIDSTNPIKREEAEEVIPPPVEQKPPPPPPEPEKKEFFQIVEIPPEYPGGQKALFQFLADHLEYPDVARENNIQGTVVVSFIVEADGSITDIKILRGLGGGCNDEAMRVIGLMPKWNPGIQSGRKVRVNLALAVHFQLRE
jgi:protein TonB